MGIIIRLFLAIAEDNNTHPNQTYCCSYNVNVTTVRTMTFDQRQLGEGRSDVDAAISGISAGRRSRAQAKEPREDVATPGILNPEFPQSYFPLIDTTRWGRL